jgi:hypothetical protein
MLKEAMVKLPRILNGELRPGRPIRLFPRFEAGGSIRKLEPAAGKTLRPKF